MCRTQCVLALVALSVGLAHSWDIAVTTGQKLEFYTNNTKTDTEGVQLRDFTALAYDAVHNMLLFVDKKRDNASIFSFNIATKKYQSLVRRSSYVNIKDIAFDPVKAMLFWIDSEEKSIFWISMKPGSKNDVYGNLLIKMDDEIPRAIAVDSCRGYIYWTNVNITKPTIERARFDGTERQVLIDTNIYKPVSLAVDQQTKKIYWADDREGIHYSIESADLNGMNRMTMLLDENHQPNALTISKDSIYWVDLDHKSVWQLPKNASKNEKPTQIISFNDEPFGIAANYTIEDQTQGNSECEALTALPRNNSLITDSGVADDVGLFCVHGIKLDGKSHCKCTPGYIGDRCDISVCQNYCFQGDCSIKDDGQPKCRCAGGYSGERCEINACHGYCLNYGACSLNEKDGPVCQCIGDYEGSRCEAVKVFTTTTEPLVKIDSNESHVYNNTKEIPSTQRTLPSNMFNDEELIESTSGGWDSVRDPVIMVLGIVCGLLCLACAVLFTKILQLRRRPRIKKRIIVNKNVTPMTARPDQCEITIENCCNMNICETPCFEPRSTIRPSLLDSKPGKEEKKNLIANMEYPDDSY